MKRLAAILLALSLTAHAQEVKDARWAALGSVAAARYFDWRSTGECVRSNNCHEVILPKALAASKPGLAAVEAGAMGGEWWLSRRLARRHPKLAVVADMLSAAAVTSTVVHNYVVMGRPGPVTVTVRPLR